LYLAFFLVRDGDELAQLAETVFRSRRSSSGNMFIVVWHLSIGATPGAK